jgi:hypothetical protein
MTTDLSETLVSVFSVFKNKACAGSLLYPTIVVFNCPLLPRCARGRLLVGYCDRMKEPTGSDNILLAGKVNSQYYRRSAHLSVYFSLWAYFIESAA